MLKAIKKWRQTNAAHEALHQELEKSGFSDINIKIIPYTEKNMECHPSMYDIPRTEARVLQSNGHWALQFRFIDSEPLSSVSYESIQMKVGKNSGRLYAVSSASSIADGQDLEEALKRWCAKSAATTTHKELMCLVVNKSSKMLKIKFKATPVLK